MVEPAEIVPVCTVQGNTFVYFDKEDAWVGLNPVQRQTCPNKNALDLADLPAAPEIFAGKHAVSMYWTGLNQYSGWTPDKVRPSHLSGGSPFSCAIGTQSSLLPHAYDAATSHIAFYRQAVPDTLHLFAIN